MPQKPIVRRRQKARRSKQLAVWREKQIVALAQAPVVAVSAATVASAPKSKTAAK